MAQIISLGTGDAISVVFNILLHAVILFTIWAVLFEILISPLEKAAIGGTLETMVDSILSTNVTQLPQEVRSFVKDNSKVSIIQRIKDYFTTPADATRVQNSWITGISYAVPIAGVVGLGLILLSLKLTNVQIPVKHILLENLITFAIVGAVEYTLFTQIAIHYAPITAGDISDALVSQVKEGLNCPQ